MKFFTKILIAFFMFLSYNGLAQQGEKLMPLVQDSSQMELGKQIEYRQLISGQMFPELHGEAITLSGFNFDDEFTKRYSLSLDLHSFNNYSMTAFSAGSLGPLYSPFNQNGMIFSEGAYKMGDKFVFGGYSYGSNPINLPPPVPGTNDFSRYGSTMYMQYKVNKNFKIETRFNISQGGIRPGF